MKNVVSEIRIRNVNAAAVVRIDQLVENSNFRSRNEYLRHYIESLAVLQDLKDQENKYTAMVESLTRIMEHNTALLKSIKIQLDRMENTHNG